MGTSQATWSKSKALPSRETPRLSRAWFLLRPSAMNLERILQAVRATAEFLLFNASNSRDFYARYSGVKIKDLLKYAGVRKEATQITVFSPDGFSKTFPIDTPDPQTDPSKVQYDVMGPYPYGSYYGGLDFVDYGYDSRMPRKRRSNPRQTLYASCIFEGR